MDNLKQCGICSKKIGMFTGKYIINNKTECVCANCLKNLVLSKRSVLLTPKLLKNLTLDTILNNPQSIGKEKDISDYAKDDKIICPNCNSINIQFMQQDKKAFSVGKAAAGTVLTGGVGSLAGFAGKKGNKQWFCKNCNTTFETK